MGHVYTYFYEECIAIQHTATWAGKVLCVPAMCPIHLPVESKYYRRVKSESASSMERQIHHE